MTRAELAEKVREVGEREARRVEAHKRLADSLEFDAWDARVDLYMASGDDLSALLEIVTDYLEEER
ncbi:hypothetical protein [Kineococcus esterisolvens]|uniref:hypothetical protein n=1 Tax=unclassified Kineococcus TaxID=2621656 RepID=UPI003D7F0C3A